uniref:DUF106 domain-containing protein n=1 Tax=Acidianus sulfidivorans JP7 TaxID=619593 RepID=A0A2U9IMS9_9CREN
MNLDFFLILLISFFSNFIIFLIYKFFIEKRLIRVMSILRQYDDRINRITSNKRKEKVYKKIYKQIKSYNSSLYFYSFLQSILLLVFYFIDLFLILEYIPIKVFLPFYIPFLTININQKYEILGSNLILFILSFVLFTPLSLKRPKDI